MRGPASSAVATVPVAIISAGVVVVPIAVVVVVIVAVALVIGGKGFTVRCAAAATRLTRSRTATWGPAVVLRVLVTGSACSCLMHVSPTKLAV